MTIPGVHLGHEFVGTVEDVGAGVRTVAKGDRVLVSGAIGCGHCPECRAGDIVVCRNAGTKVFGTSTDLHGEIGRASCRERVCQYVSISVVAVSLIKK